MIKEIRFLETLEWTLKNGKVVAAKKPFEKAKYFLESNKSTIDYPFAPGTYIELEAILDSKDSIKSNTESTKLKWYYISCDYYKEGIKEPYEIQWYLDSRNQKRLTTNGIIKDSSGYFANNNITHKIGFHLPIERNDKFVKNASFDNKLYSIIIFAFDSKKLLPDFSDKYIIINTHFEVGEMINNEIKEIRNYDLRELYKMSITANLNHINKCNMICDMLSANAFVLIVKNLAKDMSQFAFYRQYPQLIGKVAYIFYRFSIDNIKFVKNVKSFGFMDRNPNYLRHTKDLKKIEYLDGMEYLDNIHDFSSKILDVLSSKNYRLAFDKIHRLNGQHQMNILTDFIEDIGNALDIDKQYRPKVIIEDTTKYATNVESIGNYNVEYNSLHIYDKALVDRSYDLLDIIVHEYRHFYINYICRMIDNHKLTKNILFMYVSASKSLISNISIFKPYTTKYTLAYELMPLEQDANLAYTAFSKLYKLFIESNSLDSIKETKWYDL